MQVDPLATKKTPCSLPCLLAKGYSPEKERTINTINQDNFDFSLLTFCKLWKETLQECQIVIPPTPLRASLSFSWSSLIHSWAWKDEKSKVLLLPGIDVLQRSKFAPLDGTQTPWQSVNSPHQWRKMTSLKVTSSPPETLEKLPVFFGGGTSRGFPGLFAQTILNWCTWLIQASKILGPRPPIYSEELKFATGYFLGTVDIGWIYPLRRIPVTTRLVAFLVGNPNLNLHCVHCYWMGG